MTARILEVSPDEYHALPHFSSSIAKVLIERTPLHAKQMRGKPPTKEMDRGNVVHRLALGRGKAFAVLPFDDWRTKAAKEARDAARADGRVPIKEGDFESAKLIADAVTARLAEQGLVLDGRSELAMEWEERSEHGPVACRAMLDHVWLDRGLILDLKVTENASPAAIERTAENLGYGIQAAAYQRAMAALVPELAGRVRFLFAFVEPEPPFAVNVCAPDGMFRELGERRWLRAVSAWASCLKNNAWPGYGNGVNQLSVPGWALSREELAA